jgi:hypothetical protein
MSDFTVPEGRGIWGRGPAPTTIGQGGQELASKVNPEPYGPTYDTVISEKDPGSMDRQDPHYLGDLLPVAHSRSEEVRSFFDATNVLG